MKRIIGAGLLAVGLLVCSQQQASAWSKFDLNGKINFSWETTGWDFGIYFRCNPPPSGCCYTPPAVNYGYAAPAYHGAGYPAAGYGGYGGYSQGTHLYGGYQQAPSYWYH